MIFQFLSKLSPPQESQLSNSFSSSFSCRKSKGHHTFWWKHSHGCWCPFFLVFFLKMPPTKGSKGKVVCKNCHQMKNGQLKCLCTTVMKIFFSLSPDDQTKFLERKTLETSCPTLTLIGTLPSSSSERTDERKCKNLRKALKFIFHESPKNLNWGEPLKTSLTPVNAKQIVQSLNTNPHFRKEIQRVIQLDMKSWEEDEGPELGWLIKAHTKMSKYFLFLLFIK